MILSDWGRNLTVLSSVREIMRDIETTLSGVDSREYVNISPGNPEEIEEVSSIWRRLSIDVSKSKLFQNYICRYSSSRGTDFFIETFLTYMNGTYSLNLKKENVLVASGSQQVFFYLLNLFAGTRDGTQRKVFFPSSPEYTGYSGMGPGRHFLKSSPPSVQKTGTHRFRYGLGVLPVTLDDVGIAVLSRPSNPSGNIISKNSVLDLVNVCSSHKIPLVLDCAYSYPFPDLVYKDMDHLFDCGVINVFSASKCGLPGSRLGIAIGPEEIIGEMVSFQSNAALQASTFGQLLLGRAIETGELHRVIEITKDHYRRNREFAIRVIGECFPDDLPYYLHESDGTFFLWLWFENLPITDKQLYDRLKENKVLVVPGSGFFLGLEEHDFMHKNQCIRISLTEPRLKLERGIKIMASVLKDLYRLQ